MNDSISPLEKVAHENMKGIRAFVNEPGFSDIALAFIDDITAGESKKTSTLINSGKILGVRHVFKRLRELARPEPPKSKKPVTDPDLET